MPEAGRSAPAPAAPSMRAGSIANDGPDDRRLGIRPLAKIPDLKKGRDTIGSCHWRQPTMRCALAGTVAVLLASAALIAADFWEDKDFTTWSPQQVEKMLSDSPWAKKATIVLGSLREGQASGGFSSGGAGFGGGGGGRDSDGGGGEFSGVRRITVTVAWISALPVRQAIARLRVGLDAPVLPDDKRMPDDEAF